MNAADLIAALNLPASAQVQRRVPKKLLLENGAPTVADERHIKDGIEELLWIAALKPTTIGVPEYRDEERDYLEIAVLQITFRTGAKATRLIELVHRAVPYPLLLVTEHAAQVCLSAAHKRRALNEAERTVLDGDLVTADWETGSEAPYFEEFRRALALEKQPHSTIHALYQGWLDTLIAFKAARLTGSFTPAADSEQATARQEALRECARLDAEITRLRAAAGKEKQMARKVELNRQIGLLSIQLAGQHFRL